MADVIELNQTISKNQEKVRYLRHVETFVKNFRAALRGKEINPVYAPMLVSAFQKAMLANIDGGSMAPYIDEVPYEAASFSACLRPQCRHAYATSRTISEYFIAATNRASAFRFPVFPPTGGADASRNSPTPPADRNSTTVRFSPDANARRGRWRRRGESESALPHSPFK